MAQLTIVTTPTNSGDGTPLATAFNYCNSNFSELYSRVQTDPPATLVGQVGDTGGMYAYDENFFYYCFADYDGSTVIWGEIAQAGNISVTSIQRGNSNVSIGDLGANVTVGVGGVANIAVFTPTGQQVLGAVSATGNVTGSFILGNGSQLTGLPATYANSNVAAYLLTNTGNIAAGNVSVTGNVTGGNILSTGLISTSGNIASQGRISATGNIETAGYFVGTFVGNVTGNFVVPGSNTQVIFNTNGNADATAGMTFDTNGPNLFTVLGTISSQGNVVAGNITTANVVSATGNITGGNLRTAGLVTATGNITGGNIATVGLITATGNITGGNLRTAGAISATGNVSGGNVLVTTDLQAGGNVSATSHTGTTVSVTGNVSGGNIRTAGVITATGNITGNYFIGNGSLLSNVNINTISNGNSNVLISSSAGNVSINVAGSSPIALFTPLGVIVQGNVSATGTVTAPSIVGGAVTGSSASLTGNVTGANVNTGGLITATGNITGGNIVTAGNVTGGNIRFGSGVVSGSGNITGGNLSVGIGTITLGNIVNGNGNGVGNIGTSSTYFNTIFANATSAQYADLAENYVADEEYAPGTVVVFGGEAEISISREAGDERVAGVISTQPAHLMNAGQPGLPVALRGRVPVQVVGPVSKGDSLVTSSIAGHAQSVGRDRSYGQAVFAKAVETNLSPGEKIITAVIL